MSESESLSALYYDPLSKNWALVSRVRGEPYVAAVSKDQADLAVFARESGLGRPTNVKDMPSGSAQYQEYAEALRAIHLVETEDLRYKMRMDSPEAEGPDPGTEKGPEPPSAAPTPSPAPKPGPDSGGAGAEAEPPAPSGPAPGAPEGASARMDVINRNIEEGKKMLHRAENEPGLTPEQRGALRTGGNALVGMPGANASVATGTARSRGAAPRTRGAEPAKKAAKTLRRDK